MKNYSKIFKLLMWALIIVSVVLLVWGFLVGFDTNDGQATQVLLSWAYAMIILATASVVVFGALISAKNNPKSLIKLGIGIVAIAAICFVAYLLAAGKPAMGMAEQPDATTLKLTDTLLNLTYFTGALAIISIIVGEIVMTVRNKK